MPLKPIETRRLYRQVADQIGALIDGGEFVPGQRLPSERQLAVRLGVSRVSIREALIVLELSGAVRVRVGSGIYAHRGRPDQSAEVVAVANEAGPFDIIAARLVVEGETAALAARQGRAPDLSAIGEALAEMERECRQGRFGFEADFRFHLRIAEASGNAAYVGIVRDLWAVRDGHLYKMMERHFDTPERHARAVEEHRAIYDALGRRAPAEARRAMRAHLVQVRRAFAIGWKSAGVNPARSRG